MKELNTFVDPTAFVEKRVLHIDRGSAGNEVVVVVDVAVVGNVVGIAGDGSG